MRADSADVAVLPGGRLVLPDGLVVTNDGLLASESGWDDEKIDESGVLALRRLPRAQSLPGVGASLMSQWCEVYYHWVTDALPRLRILEEAGWVDAPLIVPKRLTSWQQRSLELLGIDKGRLRPYAGHHLRAERLVWPRPAAVPGHTPQWVCRWLREQFAGSHRAPERSLYLTRRREQQRRVTNEDAIWELLKARGFELIDPGLLRFDEQVAVFAEAAVIVAPHGGALTNIVFGEGACVVELFEPSYVNPCYYVLAARSGHDYWYVVGAPEAGGNIRIDPSQLEATLAAAGR